MTLLASILAQSNSFGPLPIGGDGQGFYDGAVNGGHACGAETPAGADIGGAAVSCVGYQGGPTPGFVVIVASSSVVQSLFSTLTFTDRLGNPEIYDTSTAVFDNTTYPGYSVWKWAGIITYPFTPGNNYALDIVAPPTDATVPAVTRLALAVAESTLLGASLTVGAITSQASLTAPTGTVLAQTPVADSVVPVGTAVDLVQSSGAVLVPAIIGLTAADANSIIQAAGLTVGDAGSASSKTIPYGSVAAQSPKPLTKVLPGAAVSYDISIPDGDFDVDATVISQYANSPSVDQLVHNMDQYITTRQALATFYEFVWNVDTAKDWGLNIWGNIVGVSRLLKIPGNDPIVGFDNPSDPKDWVPMSQGRFALENEISSAFTLQDSAYRVLILTKALANIITTTAPAMNQLLRNLFPGRGRAYVRDLGNMAMQFVFNFVLTPVERAILTESGVLPHPAGVLYSVQVIPPKLFGFQGYPGALPFNVGVFNSRT